MHVYIIVHRPVERADGDEEDEDVTFGTPKAHIYRAHSAGIALSELLEDVEDDDIRATDRFLVLDCGLASEMNCSLQHGGGLPTEVWKPIPPKPRWTVEVVS